MSIKDIGKKIKPYLQEKIETFISRVKTGLNIKDDIFIAGAIILVGLAGFGLGKLSALEKGREPVEIRSAQITISANGKADFNAVISSSSQSSNINKSANIPMSAAAMIAGESAKGLLVASKSGTKYHFPWCAGASQIAEKNKIWFNSYEEAQKAGYSRATNCKGLK